MKIIMDKIQADTIDTSTKERYDRIIVGFTVNYSLIISATTILQGELYWKGDVLPTIDDIFKTVQNDLKEALKNDN